MDRKTSSIHPLPHPAHTIMRAVKDPDLRWVIAPIVHLQEGRLRKNTKGQTTRPRRKQLPKTVSFGNAALSRSNEMMQWVSKNQYDSLRHLVEQSHELKLWRQYSAIKTFKNGPACRRNRWLAKELTSSHDFQDPRWNPFLRLVVLARLMLSTQEYLLAKMRPRLVLLATQHSLQARTAIINCRKMGIPTVYVPHAPVATNRIYKDLPFDYAALRGPKEVEYYRSLGVIDQRLRWIGHPGIDSLPDLSPTMDSTEERIVIATNLLSDEHFWSIVNASGIRNAVITLHPGMSEEHIARMQHLIAPGTGSTESGRTIDILKANATAKTTLVSADSGVLLDALSYGCRAIRVASNGEPSNYAFVQEPWVSSVRTPHDLHAALQSLSAYSGEAAQEYAVGWIGATGHVAHANLREFLASITGHSSPINDEWGEKIP